MNAKTTTAAAFAFLAMLAFIGAASAEDRMGSMA